MITVERKFYIQQRAIGTRGNEGWYDTITRNECSSIGDALEYIKSIPSDVFEYRVQSVATTTEVISIVRYDYPGSE